MDAKIALELLVKVDKNSVLKDKIVVLSRIGEKDEKISYGAISTLRKSELGKSPFSLIIPAKLHMVEEEFLEKI